MRRLWHWLRGLLYRPQHGAPAGLDWPDAEPDAWQRDPDTLDSITLPSAVPDARYRLGAIRVYQAPAAAAYPTAAAAGHQRDGILPTVLLRAPWQFYGQAWRAEARDYHDRIEADRRAWRALNGLRLLEAVAA